MQNGFVVDEVVDPMLIEKESPIMSIQYWFVASRYDTVTAGTCEEEYRLGIVDRSLLGFKIKRRDGRYGRGVGWPCKLYSLHEVLQLARLVHLDKCLVRVSALRAACTALDLSTDGDADTLALRLKMHTALLLPVE